jgi:hypothetical protein
MTQIYERIRLLTLLKGLRERMGSVEADRLILAVLEQYWATDLQKSEHEPWVRD